MLLKVFDLSKYDLLETDEDEVDSDLANLVNNFFREGQMISLLYFLKRLVQHLLKQE